MQLKFCAVVTLAATAIFVAACSSNAPTKTASATDNGRMIFQYGKDSSGELITATKKPLYPTCAACHKANGAGGMHLPGGATSADLRYNALVKKAKPPYTLALVERAISAGVDNQGKKLDPVMPRWTLSKQDLHDVAVYVLTLK
ncbi:MAG: cytochrome c [Candidatus Baltobacteraceae bacterium]